MVVENGKIFKAPFSCRQSTAAIRAQFPAVFRGYFGWRAKTRGMWFWIFGMSGLTAKKEEISVAGLVGQGRHLWLSLKSSTRLIADKSLKIL